MKFDSLVVAAHPDDAESQMGGTLARLSRGGQKILLVDLSDGEPTDFAEVGVRATQESLRVRGMVLEQLASRAKVHGSANR